MVPHLLLSMVVALVFKPAGALHLPPDELLEELWFPDFSSLPLNGWGVPAAGSAVAAGLDPGVSKGLPDFLRTFWATPRVYLSSFQSSAVDSWSISTSISSSESACKQRRSCLSSYGPKEASGTKRIILMSGFLISRQAGAKPTYWPS